MADKIFVSYSRKDLPQVQQIVQELGKLGLDFWMDTRNLQVGDVWTTEIARAIESCGAMLLFLSGNSMASEFVRREVQVALDKQRKLFLVKLDNAPVPDTFHLLVAGLQWVTVDAENWQSRLALSLGASLAPQPPSPVTASPLPDLTHASPGESPASPVPPSRPSQQTLAAESGQPIQLVELSKGLSRVFQKIERMCYNSDISLAEKERLQEILRGVADMKKKYGEHTMARISQEYSGNAFLQSSRTLAYYLISLSDSYEKWPNMNLSNNTKEESLTLLKRVQDEVLTTSALIDQLSSAGEKQNIKRETERIISSLRSLRLQFTNMDKHLYSGHIPYDVKDEMERHFDDLVYYLNKLILVLDGLASANMGSKLVQ